MICPRCRKAEMIISPSIQYSKRNKFSCELCNATIYCLKEEYIKEIKSDNKKGG